MSHETEDALAAIANSLPAPHPPSVPQPSARQAERERQREQRERDAAYMREWRARNRERLREYNVAWREANRERAREANRLWMRNQTVRKRRAAAQNERRREYQRDWYARNRDRVGRQQKEARARLREQDPDRYHAMANARQKRWRDKNRDVQNARLRDRRREAPGSRAEASRRYYEKNREQILARARARYAADPKRARAKVNDYRARERRRLDAGLPPRRLHPVRPSERDENQRAADTFFARARADEEISEMRAVLATPPEFLAAWARDCSRARAAHRRATDPDVAAYKADAQLRRQLAGGREDRQEDEDARLDAIARTINDRLRRTPRHPPDADVTRPHSAPGSPSSQFHI